MSNQLNRRPISFSRLFNGRLDKRRPYNLERASFRSWPKNQRRSYPTDDNHCVSVSGSVRPQTGLFPSKDKKTSTFVKNCRTRLKSFYPVPQTAQQNQSESRCKLVMVMPRHSIFPCSSEQSGTDFTELIAEVPHHMANGLKFAKCLMRAIWSPAGLFAEKRSALQRVKELGRGEITRLMVDRRHPDGKFQGCIVAVCLRFSCWRKLAAIYPGIPRNCPNQSGIVFPLNSCNWAGQDVRRSFGNDVYGAGAKRYVT